MITAPVAFSRRLRKTPFEKRVSEFDIRGVTLYNRMPLVTSYSGTESDYFHLHEHVQLWDVSCERQVEVIGKDALKLVELISPRDFSKSQIGQGLYAPLVDEQGRIINDPIIMRLADDRFWLSIADSDVLLWLKGIVYGKQLDVKVFEPDVSPLALQGPKAEDLLAEIAGEEIRDIRFFYFIESTINNIPVIICRSGWSTRDGFEIYLQDSKDGIALWDHIWQHGQRYNIRPGCPNLIDRIEGGLLSFGNDMTMAENPFECGLDKFCNIDKSAEYMARDALNKIKTEGANKKLYFVEIEGDPMTPIRDTLNVVNDNGEAIGIITTLVYSPRLNMNIANALLMTQPLKQSHNLSIIDSAGNKRAIYRCNRKWQRLK